MIKQLVKFFALPLARDEFTPVRLFKQHRIPMLPVQLCLADKGYQGIVRLHSSSYTPTKKPRKTKLDKYERQHNRLLAHLRVVAEHVNQRIEDFSDFGAIAIATAADVSDYDLT